MLACAARRGRAPARKGPPPRAPLRPAAVRDNVYQYTIHDSPANMGATWYDAILIVVAIALREFGRR